MVSKPVSVLSSKCTYLHSQRRGCMELITLIYDSVNNVFYNVSKPVFADKGYACLVGNNLGGRSNTAPQGTCSTPPFACSLDADLGVKNIVTSYAGAILSF